MKQHKEHELRVIEEREALREKIQKLSAFIQSEKCNDLTLGDFRLLVYQFTVMTEYWSILNKRISLLEP